MTTRPTTGDGVVGLLNRLPTLAPDDVAGLLSAALEALPWAGSLDVLLSDYAEVVLVPLRAHATHPPRTGGPETSSVVDSAAGRAFVSQDAVADEPDEALWLPLTNRWRRLGALRIGLLRQPSDADLVQGWAIAAFLATTVDSAARASDTFGRTKRLEPVRLTAEMQWELLPPMCIAAAGVTVAGRLEPAYDVGGDSFDYAINGDTAHVAIFDPLGHDLRSALLATLAVGAYRNARREGLSLGAIGRVIDAVIAEQFPFGCFVTGLTCELDLRSGELSVGNAGHLPPLLLREGRVRRIEIEPSRPWGLFHPDDGPAAELVRETLRPGDRVLLYTDGVVESQDAASVAAGIDLLAAQLQREAARGGVAPELLRRLLDDGEIRPPRADDATVLLVDWRGPDATPELGG